MKNELIILLLLVVSSVLTIPEISGQVSEPLNVYNDQEGRFSFSYPGNWEINLPENRFTKTSEVEVSTPDNTTGWASFDVRILPGLAESAEVLGLESAFDIGLSSARNDVPDFRMVEDIECEKYRINGEETCSVQYTRGIDLGSLGFGSSNNNDDNSNSLLSTLGRHAVQQVVFPVGEDIYMLSYGADFDNFDTYLPTAEKIYSSFRAGDSSNGNGNGNGSDNNGDEVANDELRSKLFE